jgi:iron(III) transport system substrate-binding protein
MKKLWSSILIVFSMVALVACSSGNGSSGGGTPQESNKLTVYSPHQTEMINPIVAEFQDLTGIQVDLVTGGTGELLNRVAAESGNPLGDVFWGGGAESFEAFAEYFEPYVTSEDEYIPDSQKSADHIWTGFSALPMVIMYNKNLVAEDEVPHSWEALLDEKWKGKIAYADPASSGSSYTQLATMLFAFGDDGWDYVEQLIPQLEVVSGSSMVFRGVADGEFPLGITLEAQAYQYIAGGAPVDITYPAEGTSMVPDSSALIKGAKNAENAKKFLDYLVSKEVQEFATQEFNRRSVRSDVAPPEGLIPSDQIPLVDYDMDWSAENKDEVVRRVQQIIISQ